MAEVQEVATAVAVAVVSVEVVHAAAAASVEAAVAEAPVAEVVAAADNGPLTYSIKDITPNMSTHIPVNLTTKKL